MKKNAEKLDRIKQHAEKCGLTPHQLLLEAKIATQSWPRWCSSEITPSRATMNRILAVQPEGTA